MRVLVTGASGFAGRHLTRELLDNGHEVVAFDTQSAPEALPHLTRVSGDIRQKADIARCVADTVPDACVHLAALSFVPDGNADPSTMLGVNISGTLHMLDALRDSAPGCRCLLVSSAAVYGNVGGKEITESSPLLPTNLYAVSKVAAEAAAQGYAHRYGLPAFTARPANHIGPGQSSRFVVSSFAKQLKSIAAGTSEPLLRVGNLDSVRDFTDVRDVAAAYRLLVESGEPGQAYNIASQARFRIREILQQLMTLAGVTPTIEIDPALFRPTDSSPQMDVSKLSSLTGWTPHYTVEQSIRDIFEAA